MLDEDKVGIDKIEMCTPMYQRVYQYLQKIDDEEDLESFKYVGTLEGTEETCLQMIIKCVALHYSNLCHNSLMKYFG